MAGKLRLILDNHSDYSTLETIPPPGDPAYPLVEGFAVDNLKRVARSQVIRTIDTTTLQVKGIFAETTDISAGVLGRHNLPEDARWRIELFSDITLDPGDLIHDTGWLDVSAEQGADTIWPWGDFSWGAVPWGTKTTGIDFEIPKNLVWWSVDVNGNKVTYTGVLAFRITVDLNIGTGITYFDIGRLMIGEFIEPSYNLSYGHGLSWQENTSQYRSASGTLRSDRNNPFRKLEFDLKTIKEDERPTLQHGFRNVGKRRDFFISSFPECVSLDKQEDYSGIYKITRIPKFTEFAAGYFRSKYIMEEV